MYSLVSLLCGACLTVADGLSAPGAAYCNEGTEWTLRKQNFLRQRGRQEERLHPPAGVPSAGNQLFQWVWEPEWTCLFSRRIGRMGDGGKWICDPDLIPFQKCLVYSFGSENEWSFEQAMYEERECEIHTFDPTLQQVVNKPPFVHFHPVGLSHEDAGKMSTLSSLLRLLNHTERPIDVMKIDIEGAEYDSLLPLLEGGKWRHHPPIRQVVIELHVVTQAQAMGALRLLRAMAANDYVIFHKEPNTEFAGGNCIEYAFTWVPNSAAWASKSAIRRKPIVGVGPPVHTP